MKKWKPNAKQKDLFRDMQHKKEERKCVACNGTGRYDTTNSPKCGACNGTGKVQE